MINKRVERVTEGQMTFEEYTAAVEQARADNPNWRHGQAAFNALWHLRADLSERVRATTMDPFYNDARLPEFFEWVRQNWGDAT